MVLSLLNNEVPNEDPFYIEITSVGAGTGNYNSFLRLQAGGTEEGYNTDTNNQADNKNGIWTHSLKLSDMAVLTIEGKTYYEVRLDVNEDNTAAGTPITLSELWIMGSAAAATGANFSDDNNYANDFAGFHRVFDLNGSVALQDVNEGSGTDDYRILIPTTSFDPGDVYFTLYSRFTGTDGGFEEWRVLGTNGGTNEPPPAITVDKVANVTTIAEGTPTDVTFTYTLTSQSAASDPLRLDTLVDDSATALNLADDVDLLTGFVFLSSHGTYYVGGDADGDYLLDSTETWTFRYTADDMVLDAGDARTNVVTVVAYDNEATRVSDTDDATVTGTGVNPAVQVVKTPSVTSILEGTPTDVTFTYVITNTSSTTLDPLTLVSLIDDNGTAGTGDDINLLTMGTLTSNGNGDGVLSQGESWTYTYKITGLTLNAGGTHTNVVTVTAKDDENTQVSDTDTATVTGTGVNPAVQVVKTPSVTSILEGTPTDVTFTYVITNTSSTTLDPLTLVSLIDDNGTAGTGDDINLLTMGTLTSNGNGDGVLSQGESWTYTYKITGLTLNAGGTHTNVVTVTAKDDENTQVSDTDTATVTGTGVNPAVQVVKTPSVTSILEGTPTDVTFTYVITNTSSTTLDPLTLISLIDDNGTAGTGDDINLLTMGTLTSNGNGDGVLSQGESWTYTYKITGLTLNAGGTHTNVVTVTAKDDENTQVSDTDTATVTGTGVNPAVQVVKTPSVTSILEGTPTDVTFTYVITNTSSTTLDPLTLVSLIDDNGTAGTGDDINLLTMGTLTSNGNGDGVLSQGESWTYTYKITGLTLNAGGTHTNVVTVTAKDDENTQVSDTDTATVTGTGVNPAVQVVKTPSVTSILEGTPTDVTFTYVITNTSSTTLDPLTLVSLIDDNGTAGTGDDINLLTMGTLTSNGNGDGVLSQGESWTYTYKITGLTLNAGGTHTNVVTVTAKDDENTQVSDTDTATVTGTGVNPAVQVVKTPSVTSILEGTPTDVTFTYVITNTSSTTLDPLTLVSLIDDNGTAGTGDDINLLTMGTLTSNGNGDGVLSQGESWTYTYKITGLTLNAGGTHTNVVTVTAKDDENTQVSDTDTATVTGTGVNPAVQVVKTPSVTSILEGTPTDVTFTYVITNTSSTTLDPLTLVSLIDDNGTAGTGDDINLLTMGTLTSNGNGDGVLSQGESWTYTYKITGLTLNAGGTHTNVVTVTAKDDENTQVSDTDTATVTGTDVLPDVAIVKTASTNEVQAGAVTSVTFTYAITNESTVSTDPLTIVSLIDDNGTPLDALDDKDLSALYVSGDNGNGLLDVGETWIYQWTTDILLMPGESYTNIACVNATDDEGNPVGACDDETIISSVNQAYTPGFWSNNASPIWDGNETTYAKSGGLGLVIGAPKNNAPDGEYKDLLYALKDANADGTANDPTTGFLMIGDWDRNGVADDGNNVLIVSRNYALSLLNASTKEQQDGRYQVSRDVVASWLNYVSGSYVGDADKSDGFNTTADYIQEAVDWLIATTSGNEILANNELKETAKVGMTSDAWQLGVDTGGTAAFELLAGSTIHANLDYFNNNGYILP